MTALALRDDQDQWDDKQIAVLQQSGIDNDVTKAELAAFLHTCQRTGLDPFARQIYLVGRWDKRERRKTYAPQTSIDGYRIIAQRSGEYAGQDGPFWCGPDGQWVDVWLAAEPPRAAKVGVIRKGFAQPVYAVAKWESYVQTGKDGKLMGLWSKMSDLMLAKCAEALALRKAFPNDLAGVYTAEEMAQADDPQPNLPSESPRSEPQQQTDREWLKDVTDRIAAINDKDTARSLWSEVTTKTRQKTCSRKDGEHLQSLIKRRIDAIDQSDVIEGKVVEGAVTDQEWANRFEVRVEKAGTTGQLRGLREELESVISAGRIAEYDVDTYRGLVNHRESELAHDGEQADAA